MSHPIPGHEYGENEYPSDSPHKDTHGRSHRLKSSWFTDVKSSIKAGKANYKKYGKSVDKALKHAKGTKYLPVHPIHKGEKKEE